MWLSQIDWKQVHARLSAVALSGAVLFAATGSAHAADAENVSFRISPGWSDWDMFGMSSAGLGDVNADGIPDYIGGAPLAGGEMGKVLVRSGATGEVISMWVGGAGGDRLGWSVANAGDVDADGVEDFVIGAPGMGDLDQGGAKVISGATQSMLYLFSGEDANGQLGFGVGGAGDVNGDGHADIIAGSPFRAMFNSAMVPGAFTIYSGLDGSVLLTHINIALVHLGWCVTGTGDLNGDGFPDVAASAPDSGRVVVYDAHNDAAIRVLTGSASGRFGKSLANAGDFNGDGVNDLIVGSNSGATVFSGANGAVLKSFNNRLGEAVAGAGDVDGDGLDDVIIASSATMGAPTGRAEVRGGFQGHVIAVINGHLLEDHFGASAAGMGDINGDGYPEYIVGASGRVNGTGAQYLFYGGPPGQDLEIDSYAVQLDSPTHVAPISLETPGKTDLMIVNGQSGKVIIQCNNGDGTLANQVVLNVGHRPTAAIAVDIDRDGDDDLVVACVGDHRLRFYRNQSGVLFPCSSLLVGRGPCSLASADFNRDGLPDLGVANRDDGTVTVLLGRQVLTNDLANRFQAGLTFAAVNGACQLAVGDFDADFYPDLAVASAVKPRIAILLNKQNGRFKLPRIVKTAGVASGMVAVDLTRDFRADLAWVDPAAQMLWVARGIGDGGMNPPAAYPLGTAPTMIVSLDMDFDGSPDLAVADTYEQSVRVFCNNQFGLFGSPMVYATAAPPAFLTATDLDNDGDPDLAAVGGDSGMTTVLMNHWYEPPMPPAP